MTTRLEHINGKSAQKEKSKSPRLPDDPALVEYSNSAPSVVGIVAFLGLMTILSLGAIYTTDRTADLALVKAVQTQKAAQVITVATQNVQTPPEIDPQLRDSIYRITRNKWPVCNTQIKRVQLFDHDNDVATPDKVLAVGLTEWHCLSKENFSPELRSDQLTVQYNKDTQLTGQIVGIDRFDEVENNYHDYATLFLLELPNSALQPLLDMTDHIPLAEPDRTIPKQPAQTCGYEPQLKELLCQNPFLTFNPISGFEGYMMASPMESSGGISGSPFAVTKHGPFGDSSAVVGVFSLFYNFSAESVAYVSPIGPHAQERVWNLIEQRINEARNIGN